MMHIEPYSFGPSPSPGQRDGSLAVNAGLVVILALIAIVVVAKLVQRRRERKVDEPRSFEGVNREPIMTLADGMRVADARPLPVVEVEPEPKRRTCAVPSCGDDATHPRPRVEYAVAMPRWKPAPPELCAHHARRAAAKASAFDATLLERLSSDGRTKRTSVVPVRKVWRV
jgi:hypothetical protein